MKLYIYLQHIKCKNPGSWECSYESYI